MFKPFWPLLAGVIPNDPSVVLPFVDPRESLENPVPEGVLEDMDAFMDCAKRWQTREDTYQLKRRSTEARLRMEVQM